MTMHTDKTRDRIHEAMEALYSSAQRYDAIQNAIRGGGAICLKDYGFYRRYCKRNGISPMDLHIDRDALPVTYEKPPISTEDSAERYSAIRTRLRSGRSIEATDYQFLKRYCTRTGAKMPPCTSKLLFWEIQ